ncbi:MAG: hypothetical protein Kow00129_06940 [Thermoleophilia bacterium]
MKPTVIEAKTIDEAWFLAIRASLDDSYAFSYPIQRGSFEGEGVRRQLYALSLHIEFPETRPLAPIVPEGFTPPTTDAHIEKYFADKLLNPEPAPNEEYTYSQFIVPHLPVIMEMLQKTPHTNHAVINVGDSLDYAVQDRDAGIEIPAKAHVYEHPPCLRCLQWICNGEHLHLYTFWRSWDLFAGLPENLGGLQLLNEYVAMETGFETGTLNAFSSGAHIYGYQHELVEARTGRRALG